MSPVTPVTCILDNLNAKADFQAQRYATPVTSSSHIVASAVTLGLEYTFSFERKRKH